MSVPDYNHKFSGCSSIKEYEVLSKLGEGTFGEVHKARSKVTGKIVALKKILMHNEKDGFPVTAIREIKLLKMLSHVNILRLVEMAVERPYSAPKDPKKKAIMYMVTPYMEHDLSGLLTNSDVLFTEPQIKCYMLQLLEGLRYLHDNHILHRDMKAANLLISNKGILQIADFGLARHYDEAPPSGTGHGYTDARRDYTALVVTRWYRPPELLLGLRKYTPAIDMWGVGCVFGEMFKRTPILQGSSDVAQAHMIFDLVGSPSEENMPGWTLLPGGEGLESFEQGSSKINQRFREISAPACSLLSDLLKLNWRKRITAMSALQHPYFRAQPPPAKPEELPVFDDSHELDHRKSKGRQGPPPAPAGGTVGVGAQAAGDWAGPTASLPANGSGPYYDSRPDSHDGRPRDRDGDTRRPTLLPPPPANRKPAWTAGPSDQNGNRSDGPPPAMRGEKDTYIPSYADRPPRDDKGRDRDRDRERDAPRKEYRDRARDHRDRGFDYDRRDRGDRDMSYRDRRDRGGRNECGGGYGRDSRPRYEDRPNGVDYGDKPRRRTSDEKSYGDRSRRESRSRSPERPPRRRERENDPYARR